MKMGTYRRQVFCMGVPGDPSLPPTPSSRRNLYLLCHSFLYTHSLIGKLLIGYVDPSRRTADPAVPSSSSGLAMPPPPRKVVTAAAQSVLDDEGEMLSADAQAEWEGYLDRCFSQLEWWGEATRRHRQEVDPFAKSPAFRKDPSQRNAP